jgi:hypothetical protein
MSRAPISCLALKNLCDKRQVGVNNVAVIRQSENVPWVGRNTAYKMGFYFLSAVSHLQKTILILTRGRNFSAHYLLKILKVHKKGYISKDTIIPSSLRFHERHKSKIS